MRALGSLPASPAHLTCFAWCTLHRTPNLRKGLYWVLKYYHVGVDAGGSWSWYYPHLYAPLASSMTNLMDMKISFEKGRCVCVVCVVYQSKKKRHKRKRGAAGRRYLAAAYHAHA